MGTKYTGLNQTTSVENGQCFNHQQEQIGDLLSRAVKQRERHKWYLEIDIIGLCNGHGPQCRSRGKLDAGIRKTD